MSSSPSQPLDAAYAALEAGDHERALASLGACRDVPRAALLECLVHLERDELDAARRCLTRAAEELDADDPELCWGESELLLREWRIADARAALEGLRRRAPDAETLERLALCADLEGDFAAAEQLLVEAERLDPAGSPRPPRLTEAAFDRVVEDALAGLPEALRRRLANVRIVVEPVPYLELIDARNPGATPPDLCGLFVGASQLEVAPDSESELPPSIHLFQRNLERIARDAGALEGEIRTTLYHEIGHLLGFDEEGVEAMGLG